MKLGKRSLGDLAWAAFWTIVAMLVCKACSGTTLW
jgi:hypothetical protein